MVVRTEKVDLGWQIVNSSKWIGDRVFFTGLSEEKDCQARLDWHQKSCGLAFLNNVELEWHSSSMRLLASGLLEVTRRSLVPYLLHPGTHEATSTALYKPFTGHL